MIPTRRERLLEVAQPRRPAGERFDVTVDLRGRAVRDLETVEQLARLELGVRRRGGALRLRIDDAAFPDLIALVGLDAVLTWVVELPLETPGEPETSEE